MASARIVIEVAVRELLARHGLPVQGVWVARDWQDVSVSISHGPGRLSMFGESEEEHEEILMKRLEEYARKVSHDPDE